MNATLSLVAGTIRTALAVLLATAVLAMGALGTASPAAAAETGKRPAKSGADLSGQTDRLPTGTAPTRRPTPAKPAHARVGNGQSRTELHLKLAEGLSGRVRGGGLASIKAGENLDPVVAVLRRHRARITPLFAGPENVLAEQQADLQRRSGKQLADLNLFFRVTLPQGAATARVIDELNATDLVEIAYAEPLPVAAPSITAAPLLTAATTDFSTRQGYRGPAPAGIDATYAATIAGGRGNQVKVVDVEYSWNQTHEDLAAIRGNLHPNGTPTDPWNDDDHGTAVMGELIAGDNGFGVTGIVPDAAAGMVNVNNTGGYNLANAIWVAHQNTAPGDVILIEQHMGGGPNWNSETEVGYVPAEWYQAYYDVIAHATAAGRIVVEAAGNGYQNLDAPEYGRTFDRTYRDSGAIMVGAGAGGSCGQWNEPARGRLPYSNYGGRVDVQGWGNCVTTTGYGSLQGGDRDLWYTWGFTGTSSASPIVTGAAASLSSIMQQRGLAAPTSTQMRSLLRQGATPQTTTGALTGNIGPLPNLRNAIATLGGGTTTCTDDSFEANDGMAQATPLAFGAAVDAEICPGNLDLFALTAQAGNELTVDLAFTHAAGDLDVSLHGSDGTRIAVAESTTDDEQLTVTAAASGTHYVMVYGYQQAGNSYRLTVTRGGDTGCADDNLEPNDAIAAATTLAFGAAVDGTVCPNNVDLFEVDLAAGETLTADLGFTHSAGDLDLSLHAADGTRLAVAQSTSDNERLDYTAAASGRVVLQVYGYQGSTNTYRLSAGRVPALLGAVQNLSARAGLGRATLSWTIPAGVAAVDVRVAAGATAPGPHAGTSVYRGAGSQVTKTGLASGTRYTFAVYTLDGDGNVGPGKAVVVRGTKLAASAPASVRTGTTARIRGLLQDATSGAALPNRTVVLYQRKAGSATWSRVAAKTTSSTGGVTFARTPTTTMKYQLRFPGKARDLGSVSTAVTVRVP